MPNASKLSSTTEASISFTRGAERPAGARSSPRAAPAALSSPPITAPMAVSGPSRPLITAMGRGDRVIANSLYTAKLIAERHHAARERIRIIYRGIDNATFDPLVVPPGPIAKLRERWGVKPDTKIVLQAARLTGLKGHRHTIEAAAKLDRQGALDGAVIVFAGDAPGKAAYRQELIDLIARHGLQQKVLLVGHCDDMPSAFLAAHVAILPSLVAETFGRTSIEAQAMGYPVIVSDLGALPETIDAAGGA